MIFSNSKWIWCKTNHKKDNYSEFVADFNVKDCDNVILRIACDSVYCVNVNDSLAGFSGCADFPTHKFYDEIDIGKLCKHYNKIKITVWHFGQDSQTYISDTAGVIFEITSNDNIVCQSDENTLSREVNEYANGLCKTVTSQLGYSFCYDNTVTPSGYQPSVVVDKCRAFFKRNIKQLVLQERTPVTVTKRNGSILIDLGCEKAGFVDLDIVSPTKQKILFAYGEHIADGVVRRIIGNRDFSFEFVAKQGENKYVNYLRRFAGRYIEIFAEQDITVNYVGIRNVVYPLAENKVTFDDRLLQQIYDTSVNTLRLCMHEHYEDCPWREQALYTMDSRNQMLCGYYAFVGTEYQRHNLVIIANSLRKDGLLSICAPSGTDVPIPFFSLVYVMQVCEYVERTGDREILNEVGDTAKTIMHTFATKIDDNRLIPSFPYPYWNFYEWADESNNEWQITRKSTDVHKVSYDLILNCMYVYATTFYNKLFADKLDATATKQAIQSTFYNNKTGNYNLSTVTQRSSQLGNALAILCDVANGTVAEKITSDDTLICATLSMKTFVYDALLKCNGKYKQYVLDDIKSTYGKMLEQGATTFWETEQGESDFDGAGSLCHGWSAIPVYYLHLLCKQSDY